MRIPRIVRNTLVLSVLLFSSASSQSLSANTTTTTSVGPAATTTTTTATTDFIIPSAITTTASPASTSLPIEVCPSPLIANTRGLDISTCIGPCCIKCPAVNSFYEPNKVTRILNAAYVTRQVSLVLSVFMAISYILLPGKRSQPHISVLFLTVSMSFWYASFDIMPGVSNACINDFEESTGHNSRLCGIQGVLIVYLTQTSALWCSMLIYKLHLLAVWRSDFIDRYYGWLTAFCWIFPLGFAIPVAVKNLSQYPGMGFSCMTSTDNLNTYLFYPTAIYIYPGLLCHAVTVTKMIHLVLMSSRADGLSQLSSDARMKVTATAQAKRMIRGQWRPALMLGTVMASLTIFWLFYFINAHRLTSITPETSWVSQWLSCIMTSGAQGLTSFETQTICAKEIANFLPSITWFGFAELLLASLGIVVSLVFVSKVDFWSDWTFVLSNIFRRGKLGRGRGSSINPKSPDIEQTPRQNPYADIHIRKGVYPGHSDMLPEESVQEHRIMSISDYTNGAQWYDMDDLLDKEYDIQDGDQQWTTNHGSRVAITSTAARQTRIETPHYLSRDNHDPHSGDILYHPPIQERETNTAWMPGAQAPASPWRAYLVANDSADRYNEQPVIPSPVPRASIKAKGDLQLQVQQRPLPPMESILSRPTDSPTFVQTSLSPMPPKLSYHTSATSLSRQPQPDSDHVVGSVRGSPTTVFEEPSTSLWHQSSSSSRPTAVQGAGLNTREGTERIMRASRESLIRRTSSRNQQPKLLSQQSSDSVRNKEPWKNNTPSALDLTAKNPQPPSIPVKSPARQAQFQPYSPDLQLQQ